MPPEETAVQLKRILASALILYAVIYLAQYLGSNFYSTPQTVWDILNPVSAVFILIALASNLVLKRSALLIAANAILAIWFLNNWFDLLTLDAGESVSTHRNVIWHLIGGLIPIVLSGTAYHLWKREE